MTVKTSMLSMNSAVSKASTASTVTANQTQKEQPDMDFGMLISKSTENAGQANGKVLQNKVESSIKPDNDKTKINNAGQSLKAQNNKNDIQKKNACDNQPTKTNDTVKAVKEEIKEDFDISEEELEDAMSRLGITDNSLLSMDVLQKLVLELSGVEDPSKLLTDPQLLTNIQGILDKLTNVISSEGQLENISNSLPDMESDIVTNPSQAPIQNDAVNITISNDNQSITSGIVDDNEKAANASALTDNPVVNEQENDDTSQLKQQIDALTAEIKNKTSVSVKQSLQDMNNGGGESKNEQKQLNGQQTLEMFSENLSQTITKTITSFTVNEISAYDSLNIVRQIIDTVKLTNTSQLHNIEIQLNPENLGKLNLSVTVKNGIVTASITAENEQVRKAIESQMTTLKADFEKQGIKVDAVEVLVRGHEFDQNGNLKDESENEKNSSRNGRKQLSAKELEQILADDDQIVDQNLDEDMLKNQNSSVSYSA